MILNGSRYKYTDKLGVETLYTVIKQINDSAKSAIKGDIIIYTDYAKEFYGREKEDFLDKMVFVDVINIDMNSISVKDVTLAGTIRNDYNIKMGFDVRDKVLAEIIFDEENELDYISHKIFIVDVWIN